MKGSYKDTPKFANRTVSILNASVYIITWLRVLTVKSKRRSGIKRIFLNASCNGQNVSHCKRSVMKELWGPT